jgi:L-asparaginase II
MGVSVVEVVRGPVVESRHRVSVAVVDGDGTVRAVAGDPELVTYFRSAAKPLQALPLVQDGVCDRFGITEEELAICCGSHSGEPRHVEVAGAILGRIGLDGEALACGPHPPFHEASRRDLVEAGLEPRRMHNNCSGKHAGMMALARAHGWSTTGYERLEHPVQRRILTEVAAWCDTPEEGIAVGVDGCGVVCFAMSIRSMAHGFARLASAARRGDHAAERVVGAMTTHPTMVAGSGRLCTDLIRQGGGRLFAKVGAEGVYCVGVPGAELGIAVKVEDGSRRAVGPAVIETLRQLDLVSEDDVGALARHAMPELRNTRGEPVGELRARIELRSADA